MSTAHTDICKICGNNVAKGKQWDHGQLVRNGQSPFTLRASGTVVVTTNSTYVDGVRVCILA